MDKFICYFYYSQIGCLCLGIIHCQDNVPVLADIEPPQDDDMETGFSVDDSSLQLVNDTDNLAENRDIITKLISTTNQTSEPFSCHECSNCNSKSDFISRICESGITMCYVRLVLYR